jgi:hypothetical protein
MAACMPSAAHCSNLSYLMGMPIPLCGFQGLGDRKAGYKFMASAAAKLSVSRAGYRNQLARAEQSGWPRGVSTIRFNPIAGPFWNEGWRNAGVSAPHGYDLTIQSVAGRIRFVTGMKLFMPFSGREIVCLQKPDWRQSHQGICSRVAVRDRPMPPRAGPLPRLVLCRPRYNHSRLVPPPEERPTLCEQFSLAAQYGTSELHLHGHAIL